MLIGKLGTCSSKTFRELGLENLPNTVIYSMSRSFSLKSITFTSRNVVEQEILKPGAHIQNRTVPVPV